MLDKLAGLAIPPWVRIAIPALLVVAIFSGGMWLQRKIDSGQIEKVKGENGSLKLSVEDRNETITALKDNAKAIDKTLVDNAKVLIRLRAELIERMEEEPKIVVRWREIAAEVPDHVTADAPCEQQVGEGLGILQRAIAERDGS